MKRAIDERSRCRNRRSRCLESVFTFPGIDVHDPRNPCSRCFGMDVHLRLESAFTMPRNTQWDGFLLGKRYLIHDRDPLFTEAVRGLLRDSGVKPLRLPANSPNLNAYAEKFVLSIRRECLDRFVPLSERHLRTAVNEYVVHYHTQNGTTKVSATSSSHLCRQARMTLASSCRESDLGAFSTTTAVPRRLSPATVAPRRARPA